MHKYRIITFDGGGVRTALTITLLKRLHAQFPELIDKAQLLAGTSTGSLLALALAYGKSPEELMELFSEKNWEFIFTPKFMDAFKPKYSNEHLTELLLSVFPADLRLRDLPKLVLVPSYLLRGSDLGPWSPVFYHNFPNSPYSDELVINVALSGSASPIYFPSYQNHIDGGIITNTPSTAAIAFAHDKQGANQELDNIFLLSLGSGYCPTNIIDDTTKWGAIDWVLNPLIPFPLINLLYDGGVEADVYFSSRLLNNQYYRLNPPLSESIPLDAYAKIPDLISLAQDLDLTSASTWIKYNWFYRI
ncbi:MAG: hypothetical protein JG781_2769 [Peptococcaceae bacterium]|jgi:patatin-like phospholipase/acyl hydrolase|nr:hypothetical protein [Peptococcaceae bacterium]